MAASAESLEQKVFDIFTTTHEVLKAGKEKAGDGKNSHAAGLAELIEDIDTEVLKDLIARERTSFQMNSGVEIVRARDKAYFWTREATDIKLANLALSAFVERQNQAVAKILGDASVTVTALEGSEFSVRSLPEEGAQSADGAVTGRLAEVHTDTRLITLTPEAGQAEGPSLWIADVIKHDATPAVELQIAA